MTAMTMTMRARTANKIEIMAAASADEYRKAKRSTFEMIESVGECVADGGHHGDEWC
jgi:hypothetical protein